MRDLADEARIEQFMRALGRVAQIDGRVYLTGGATAVLYGWRQSTIDVGSGRLGGTKPAHPQGGQACLPANRDRTGDLLF